MDKPINFPNATVEQLLQIIRFEDCSNEEKINAYKELSGRYYKLEYQKVSA
jgi:hypothetical protein